jgi:hypothetical protein
MLNTLHNSVGFILFLQNNIGCLFSMIGFMAYANILCYANTNAIHCRYDCCSLQIRLLFYYMNVAVFLLFLNMIVVYCRYDCCYRIVAYFVYNCSFCRYDSVIYYIYNCCLLLIRLLYTQMVAVYARQENVINICIGNY